ncbi:neurensin-1-like [Metopolophium dirhodum]|uniref:neurensin-1-like n=1 Tax=Metopolophium dirhodum TaxID=44670 RepID=UPI0029906C34|nr:neurensin-1-like [Metopolophium dirhodum]XP_060868188.1 neurensin-1-like [Metopolophium dirhodum]XP_060868189.1 neurensin-1-like [Metopolophium dirhodum]XP_060868190.1 neurensin-1-like [Metopolophium dirhodum]XP_060868191.1 neurensin-1-like [Metopolophium dirhodum]
MADATAAAAGRRSDGDDNTGGGDGNNSGPPVLTVHMTSDNDGDTVVVSSGCSGFPSPVLGAKTGHVPATAVTTTTTTATAAKGILVHNNKKSANTNRVSFVTNSSSSPSAERSKKKHYQPRRSDDEADDVPLPYHARTGRRLTGFGVKSYLHEFYDDPDGSESFQVCGGGGGNDDFKYFVEPEVRWYRHCYGVYAVLGLAIMAVGAIALAAGHLIPAKDPVVGRSVHMEVIDRRAVSFNDHLASCRYVGSVVFAVGFVFTVVRFWASVIRGGRGISGNGEDHRVAEKLRAGEERPSPTKGQRAQTVRIPITGTLENVQPDPTAIKLQFADSS